MHISGKDVVEGRLWSALKRGEDNSKIELTAELPAAKIVGVADKTQIDLRMELPMSSVDIENQRSFAGCSKTPWPKFILANIHLFTNRNKRGNN